MGFLNPLHAIIVSFCFLGIMIYKRVNLAITLNATALLLALLSLEWSAIPTVVYENTNYATPEGRLAISVVLATFGIMLLSQLYNETGVINRLSESLSRIVKNSKVVLSVIPAIIGFLPVPGGALMSAPIVDSEAEKLKFTPEKKAYVNLWFRHTIFPVYPISQLLITTAALTAIPMFLIILRQIPVVIVMIAVGCIFSFWKVSEAKDKQNSEEKNNSNSDLRDFLISFSPILATIVVVVGLSLSGFGLSKQGFDILVATFIGLIFLVAISKSSIKVLAKPFKSWGLYGVTFAVYGAFLLRNTIVTAGISEVFKPFIANGNVDTVVLLTVIPGILGFLTGSPLAGVSISVSILYGIVAFSPQTASLIYMSSYLGYIIAPTHLCFRFTADYFKCPLGKAYKYVVPSFLVTFATALLIYFLA
ncbi:MAG: DUF401 family protein [Candidatus Bathyarchaeota archaeon]|nr:DUF401 family protein [Candidatus Bathyarchaeota archaeon]MDH5787391.1 DUF401 family protein [Candidatus Bathyarchaeota archaeon]